MNLANCKFGMDGAVSAENRNHNIPKTVSFTEDVSNHITFLNSSTTSVVYGSVIVQV